jgi:hypothetical protein
MEAPGSFLINSFQSVANIVSDQDPRIDKDLSINVLPSHSDVCWLLSVTLSYA